jgi:hypothetical protein
MLAPLNGESNPQKLCASRYLVAVLALLSRVVEISLLAV